MFRTTRTALVMAIKLCSCLLQVQPEQLPGLKELALLDVGRILQDAIGERLTA